MRTGGEEGRELEREGRAREVGGKTGGDYGLKKFLLGG